MKSIDELRNSITNSTIEHFEQILNNKTEEYKLEKNSSIEIDDEIKKWESLEEMRIKVEQLKKQSTEIKIGVINEQ